MAEKTGIAWNGFWKGFSCGILFYLVISLFTTTTPERAIQNLKAWALFIAGT